MITIKDIARLANVAPSTVSKALNDRSDVSEDTKQKILEIAQQHNFTPNAFGKGLKKRTTENIGVIFCREHQPLSGNPFYSRVLEGIESEIGMNNFNLLLHLIPECNQDTLPKMVRERQIDGLILVGILRENFVNKIIEAKVPLVLVDPKFTIQDCHQIFIDNEHGALIAVQYLIAAGHRKIGFISGDLSRLSFKQRYDGYLKALKSNRIIVENAYVKTGGLEQGYEHVKFLLTQKEPPTAIFSANDINAICGYKAVQELNLNVPDDISFVGFDDIDLGRISTPALTTIRVHKQELGSIAVRTLFRIIKGELSRPVHTIVPVELVERESVKRLNGAK
ncbi:MAG: LacI family transcriptional regulator [bacterium]|jgi:LacI family transcriptional regulator|nr:LacI family transcriptional regulator [bacterium]